MPPADKVTVVPSSFFSAAGAAAPSFGVSTSAFASAGGMPSARATLVTNVASNGAQRSVRARTRLAIALIDEGSPSGFRYRERRTLLGVPLTLQRFFQNIVAGRASATRP